MGFFDNILKGKIEEETWAGSIKRDGEFEKSLDRKLRKSCSRCSLDEKRQLKRNKQTPKARQQTGTGKDKSVMRSNRIRKKRKPKTGQEKEKRTVVGFSRATDAWGCG